jgi:hypothetical protein
MGTPELDGQTTQQDLVRFWQAIHDGDVIRHREFAADRWQQGGDDSAAEAPLPKNETETARHAAKKTQRAYRCARQASGHWNYCQFWR